MGSYLCSALAPVWAPRNDVAGPPPSSHWAQISGWGLKRNGVSVNSCTCVYGILKIQLEHSGGAVKATNENTGRCIKI